jgi:hypothetical protein
MPNNKSTEHWLYFSFEELPIIFDFVDNLKEENLGKCTSVISCKMPEFYIIKKKMEFKNKKVEIYITYKNKEYSEVDLSKNISNNFSFSRGVLYVNGKPHNILNYLHYESLKIGSFCYDNIGLVQISGNAFE